MGRKWQESKLGEETEGADVKLGELIDAAAGGDASVEEILRRCKVVASSLGHGPLESWLLWESTGYPEGAELPGYRVWPLVIKADFINPGWKVTNHLIPPAALPDGLDEDSLLLRCSDSVSTIEYTLASTVSEMVALDMGNLSLLLNERVYEGMHCTRAWGEFHKGRFADVLGAVRNRVLDFALALARAIPEGQDATQGALSLPEPDARRIVNMTVLAGMANVVGMEQNSTLVFQGEVNSFEDLAGILRDRGIRDEDLLALRKALDSDPKPSNQDAPLGPKVSDWMGRMISKAASGVWDITVPVASTLLANAIWAYYLAP